jgi:hypothetical protein
VSELEQRLTHAEYVEWQAYAAIEPFGDGRADLRAAIVAAASQAPHLKSIPKVSSFLPYPEDRFDPPESEEDQFDRVLDRASRAARKSDRM